MGSQHRPAHIPPFSKIRALIERHVREVSDAELSDFAVELKNDLVKGITHQDFPSFKEYPLNPAYKARKKFKGLDTRTLIATGHYVKSITVIPRGRGRYEVNVPENARVIGSDGRPKDMTLRELGAIHEYGSAAAGIPARRHWSVVFHRGQQKAPIVAQRIANKAAEKINADLRRGLR